MTSMVEGLLGPTPSGADASEGVFLRREFLVGCHAADDGVAAMAIGSIARGSMLAFAVGALVLTGFISTGAIAKKGKDDTSRRICKVVMPTGSRMTTRICRTQAEWDRSMDKSQQGLLDQQTKQSTQYAR